MDRCPLLVVVLHLLQATHTRGSNAGRGEERGLQQPLAEAPRVTLMAANRTRKTSGEMRDCLSYNCYYEFAWCGMDPDCGQYLKCGKECQDKGQHCFLTCLTSIKGRDNEKMRVLYLCGRKHDCFNPPLLGDKSVDTTCQGLQDKCSLTERCSAWRNCTTENRCGLLDSGCLARCSAPAYSFDRTTRHLLYCSIYNNIPLHLPGRNATTQSISDDTPTYSQPQVKAMFITAVCLMLLLVVASCVACCRCCYRCCCYQSPEEHPHQSVPTASTTTTSTPTPMTPTTPEAHPVCVAMLPKEETKVDDNEHCELQEVVLP